MHERIYTCIQNCLCWNLKTYTILGRAAYVRINVHIFYRYACIPLLSRSMVFPVEMFTLELKKNIYHNNWVEVGFSARIKIYYIYLYWVEVWRSRLKWLRWNLKINVPQLIECKFGCPVTDSNFRLIEQAFNWSYPGCIACVTRSVIWSHEFPRPPPSHVHRSASWEYWMDILKSRVPSL